MKLTSIQTLEQQPGVHKEQEFAGMVRAAVDMPESELGILGCMLVVAGRNSDRILDCTLLAVDFGVRMAPAVDRRHPADSPLSLLAL